MISRLSTKELRRLIDLISSVRSAASWTDLWTDITEKLEQQLEIASIEWAQLNVKLTEAKALIDIIDRQLTDLTGE